MTDFKKILDEKIKERAEKTEQLSEKSVVMPDNYAPQSRVLNILQQIDVVRENSAPIKKVSNTTNKK